MDSSNSCDEGEQNQSKQTQRQFEEQENELSSETYDEYVNEIDKKSQSFQNHDNSQEKSFIEIGGFEPFAFPFFMLENRNETNFKINSNQNQLCPLETSKRSKNQPLEQNNESNTEFDENSIQKSMISVKNKKKQNKRKFEVTLMASLLNYQPGGQKKFYLFLDRVLDINYLKLLAKNQGEEKDYIHEEDKVCVFKGNKLVNQVSHRIDNKCIEVISEEINKPVDNFEQIIKMLLSLGNQHIFEMANNLQHFWDNISKFENMIKAQSEDELFQFHMVEREKASNEMFQRMTTQFDQDQYFHYVYFKVDYENYRLFNYRTGFSPKLYELIAGNAYAFKESLLKDGFYDPIYLANRLNMCLDNYLSQYQPKDFKAKYYQSNLNHSFNLIKTLDGLFIPSLMKRELINVNIEYDTENNLNFKVNDFLAINVFELIEDNEEENIENQLRDFRMGQKYSHESDQQLKEIDQIILEKQFKTEAFLKKYYPDDITSLMDKGSKWFKQCGVADIPQKKRKKKEQ